MTKKPPQIVCRGLTTKSAKIRALAVEGYSRTDIAQYLEIRYQHVRNVLVQDGIEAGKANSLTRKSRLSETKRPIEPWPIAKLLSSGFEKIAICQLTDIDCFNYTAKAPNDPGVYAFSVNGEIKYVGLTRGTLRTRLGHYVYGHAQQKTSARIKGLILSELTAGNLVEVCIARPPNLEWNGLPVDGPAGLETALIRLICPPWNQQGTKQLSGRDV